MDTGLQFEYFISFHPNSLKVIVVKVCNCRRQWLCSYIMYTSLMFRLWWQLFLNLGNFSYFSAHDCCSKKTVLIKCSQLKKYTVVMHCTIHVKPIPMRASEAHLGPCQRSRMKFFAKIVKRCCKDV